MENIPNLQLEGRKNRRSMLQHGPKRRCPLFSTLKVFFSGWYVSEKSLSCWKSRLCECRISYGSAPNARPSHGPSVRMESGNWMITPPKTNMAGGPQNDGWEMVVKKKWPFLDINSLNFLDVDLLCWDLNVCSFWWILILAFAFVEKN